VVAKRDVTSPVARGGASRRRLVMWSAALVLVSAAVALGAANMATSTSTSPTSKTPPEGPSELGNTPRLPADLAAYFAPIRAALAAPIVFGNLEGTMINATTSKCAPTSTECYAFRVPTSYATIYRAAGFRVLNSANLLRQTRDLLVCGNRTPDRALDRSISYTVDVW
jgi:hypothetical protein